MYSKKFYRIGPWSQSHKIFLAKIYALFCKLKQILFTLIKLQKGLSKFTLKTARSTPGACTINLLTAVIIAVS